MKILVKFPSRSRPEQFLKTLQGWIDLADNPADIAFLVSYDADDATMTDDVIARAKALHPAVMCVKGNSKSKVEAINCDIEKYYQGSDIILVISDDMWCRRRGWDNVIRNAMLKSFPDTDGSLWIFDNSQRRINTIPCFGRKFYERTKYIYHPSYFSLWCDNEQTEVGLKLLKLVFVETTVATHEHHSWGKGMQKDALYAKNDQYWSIDKENFLRRRDLGFPA